MWAVLIIFVVVQSLDPLPNLNSTLSETTVSGFSSGGYMATQMCVAYSDYIDGCGIFAGGPYACGYGQKVQSSCDGLVNLTSLINITDQLADQRQIGSTNNLDGKRVYFFSGMNDTTVLPADVIENADFFEHYNANVTTEFDIDAGHGIPRVDYGVPCYETAFPYINKCGYAGVETALTWMFRDLKPGVTANLTNLVKFDQTKYQIGDSFQINGYVYKPEACQNGAACKVHIAFHGCTMGTDTFGTDYVTYAGYNELAEANNLVILYPQVTVTNPQNPYGCWDFSGYNYNFDGTLNYLTKQGKQILAVWKMVEDMVAPATPKCDVYSCGTGDNHEVASSCGATGYQAGVPSGACWLRNLCSGYDEYFVKPCADKAKPVCPMPPSNTIKGICEAAPDTPYITAYPGEKCKDKQSICFNGQKCHKDVCQGLPTGTACGQTLECAPGNYCSGKVCTKLLGSGDTCVRDFDCGNNYYCSSDSKCTKYSSISNGEDCTENKQCKSFFCSTQDNKCYDAPKSAGKIPLNCNSSPSACNSVTWTQEDGASTYMTSTCACGYNSKGDRYCSQNPGDYDYKAHSIIMESWLTGSKINNCNTARRESDGCMKSYMDDDDYVERSYYFDNLRYMYRYIDTDSCVQQALFDEYYEEKDEVENDDFGDDDFAGVLIAVYLLNLF